jgi:signal transduction histidine kinase
MATEIVTKDQLEYLLAMEPYLADTPDITDNSPFMRFLISADRKQLADSLIERNCAPGEIVFREGDRGETMYVLGSGRIAIVKGDLNSPTILSFQSAGSIIGEMALLENQPRSATIVALDNLRLLGLSRQKLHQLVQDTPSASFSIMEMLSARLRKTDEARITGELSEKRLMRQVSALQTEKQRLEEIQRLRQETLELIIHDLRNPLSAIAVSHKMLTLILPDEILRANRELMEVVKVSVERMQHLVDSLLGVSSIESGETEFIMSEVNLKELVEEVVKRISFLERKGINLHAKLPADLPNVLADRDIIERVLTNLVDNALKYTPDNGQITFSAERQGDFVWVSVADTGPGVPPEERERIFERFAQGTSEKIHRRGFGLGLAYCRLAVERHGGRIWVEPGEGDKGSRFAFTLPVSTP